MHGLRPLQSKKKSNQIESNNEVVLYLLAMNPTKKYESYPRRHSILSPGSEHLLTRAILITKLDCAHLSFAEKGLSYCFANAVCRC
jgi:hypothetical protein